MDERTSLVKIILLLHLHVAISFLIFFCWHSLLFAYSPDSKLLACSPGCHKTPLLHFGYPFAAFPLKTFLDLITALFFDSETCLVFDVSYLLSSYTWYYRSSYCIFDVSRILLSKASSSQKLNICMSWSSVILNKCSTLSLAECNNLAIVKD